MDVGSWVRCDKCVSRGGRIGRGVEQVREGGFDGGEGGVGDDSGGVGGGVGGGR